MTYDIIISWIALLIMMLAILFKVFVKFGYRAIYVLLILNFILPTIFFPFAFNSKNLASVGYFSYRGIINHLPAAWYVFSSSALFFFVSFYMSIQSNGKRQLLIEKRVFLPIQKIFLSNGISRSLLIFQISIFSFLIYNGFKYGSGLFDSLASPIIRPVGNVWQVVSTFSVIMLISKAYLNRSFENINAAILTIAMSGLTGQRAVSLLPLIVVLFSIMDIQRIKMSIKPFLMIIILAPLAIAMHDYRSQIGFAGAAKSTSSMAEDLAYGNQFSEIRDLAWIKSGYDGRPLLGITYLAGYSAILPSVIAPFRQKWSYGRWTVKTAGLDTSKHPGFRGGPFSEVYFNFGFIVSLLVSAIAGFIYGRILMWEVTFNRQLPKITHMSIGISSYLAAYFMFNTIFSIGFFYVIIITIILVLVNLIPVQISRPSITRSPSIAQGSGLNGRF